MDAHDARLVRVGSPRIRANSKPRESRTVTLSNYGVDTNPA